MPDSAASDRVRSRFRSKARQFDDLYEDERPLSRRLRPGLYRRRVLAVQAVEEYDAPAVLDVGCGSGRIGEFALEAGAAFYLGVDFSEPMLELARSRLARFGEHAQLILDDFLTVSIERTFDVVLALGLFDYLPDPERFAGRLFDHTAPGGCMVASFPAWSLMKGPIRKVRYEWIGGCPIFNYTQRDVQLLLAASGFDPVQISSPGHSGCLIHAHRPQLLE
jgi:SAM-dependent methyltransferase